MVIFDGNVHIFYGHTQLFEKYKEYENLGKYTNI